MFVSSPKLPQYATRSSTVIMVDDQRHCPPAFSWANLFNEGKGKGR